MQESADICTAPNINDKAKKHETPDVLSLQLHTYCRELMSNNQYFKISMSIHMCRNHCENTMCWYGYFLALYTIKKKQYESNHYHKCQQMWGGKYGKMTQWKSSSIFSIRTLTTRSPYNHSPSLPLHSVGLTHTHCFIQNTFALFWLLQIEFELKQFIT